MILDTGNEVYLWCGPSSSEVERKLSFKSAQVTIHIMLTIDPPLKAFPIREALGMLGAVLLH